ncbi:CHAP domain-containing protein [Candidatus Saccharibacteria bacterium]|nr:CHAP domain-containing protein [Candidatus Saccharibacteria bacterium]
MVILKRLKLILISSVLFFTSCLFSVSNPSETFATSYCVTDACKAAEAAEATARDKAADAVIKANDLESVVQGLELDIYALEAKIASNKAVAEDLKAKIEANKTKLEIQKTALASLLVDNYFDSNPDAIMILASSNSISDLTEKESRAETVKSQINASAKQIKSIKNELESQKNEVDKIIENQNNQREEINRKRAEQNALIEQYKNNADAFSAEAEEARKAKQEEIQAYISQMNVNVGGGVITDPGLNSYPYAGQCPGLNWRYTLAGYGSDSRFGGYYCECVSYAAWKVYEFWGHSIYWGDANDWGWRAENAGFYYDRNPEPYTVGFYTNQSWGHVVWVEGVNGDGTINYSEYNGAYTADFSYRTNVSASNFYYIHFR